MSETSATWYVLARSSSYVQSSHFHHKQFCYDLWVLGASRLDVSSLAQLNFMVLNCNSGIVTRSPSGMWY